MLAIAAMLSACGSSGGTDPSANDAVAVDAPLRHPAADAVVPVGAWSVLASAEGTGLSFAAPDAAATLHLICAAKTGRLLVSLPAARPVASEERLSFGGGGEVVALVADPAGDRLRGGVSAVGITPPGLEAMLVSGPGASYGATAIGPLPAVAAEAARQFVAACRPSGVAPAPSAPSAPCRQQDGKALTFAPRRALGTEPFWNVAIDGRCLTYSTPDNPAGSRVWSQASADGRRFTGALDGKPFLLTLTDGQCSDGMSDKRYPMSAALTVVGEQRRGCAEPR